jgi:hypothetical protein
MERKLLKVSWGENYCKCLICIRMREKLQYIMQTDPVQYRKEPAVY